MSARPVLWDGRSAARAEARRLLSHAPVDGALRLVIQQLRLQEQGSEVGRHELIDLVLDVGGNLVALHVRDMLREGTAGPAGLDAMLDVLRADVTADLGTEPDSLELVVDADGEVRVLVVLECEVTPAEIEADPRHPALHGGAYHIAQDAPGLEDLRDRLAAPRQGVLARLVDTVRERLGRG